MNHEESKLQKQCVAWFRAQYPQYAMLLVHPINEGSGHTTMDRRRQGIHKAEGAVAGVPDLLLAHPSNGYHGLWIEMKNGKAGRLSDSQKEMIAKLEAQDYACAVCHNMDEFMEIVGEYIFSDDTSAISSK